jgi:hypothetical protein
MFIPDPDLNLLPIPDPGIKNASDPQHCPWKVCRPMIAVADLHHFDEEQDLDSA